MILTKRMMIRRMISLLSRLIRVSGQTDSGTMKRVRLTTQQRVHGSRMRPAGGSRILQAGIRLAAGRRQTVSGITSELMDIWLQVSGQMITGWTQMELAATCQEVAGEETRPAGGMRMNQAGIRLAAGRRQMVYGTISELPDIWQHLSGQMITGWMQTEHSDMSQEVLGKETRQAGGMKIQQDGSLLPSGLE